MNSSNSKNALVIGSSGGIAKVLVDFLLEDESIGHVHTVSRQASNISNVKLTHYQIDSVNDSEVSALVKSFKNKYTFYLIICCIGTLHGGDGDKQFRPEKRLESLNTDNMYRYFQTNTLAPMNWSFLRPE